MLHTSDCKWYWLVKLIFVKLGSLGLGLPEVFGRLAQLVEQLTLNQRVKGSSPLSPSNFNDLAGVVKSFTLFTEKFDTFVPD